MHRYRAFLLAALLLWLGSQAVSQPPRGDLPLAVPANDDVSLHPLNAKMLAKAKFAALHADPKDLAQAKMAAARAAYQARYREFLAGRGDLSFLQEAQLLVLEAELGVSSTKEQRLAAFEKRWEYAWEAERISKGRYDAGRISIQDYMQTVCDRLDAQIEWAKARSSASK